MVFAGCEKKNKNKEPEQQQPSGGEQGGEQGGGEQQQQNQDFAGLSLPDAQYTYDGQPHAIIIVGDLPQGAQVTYGEGGNSFTDPGTYPITATVSCEGYNSLTLSATLTIVKAQFVGLSMVDATVTYDGAAHGLTVSGEKPEGTEVTFGANGNAFINAGEYPITATVSCHGYEDLELHATLTIAKADFEGITFENLTVTYDGQPHSIAPVVPESYNGAQISYDEHGNTFTATGTHEVNATVSLENYNDWTGTAYVIIADAHFAGLSMENKTVTYNGSKQTIELIGDLPAGATATYVEGFDGATMPGTYTVKIDVSAEGFETLHLMATLTIEPATFAGITFEDASVTYDGQPHSIAPNVPAAYEGAQITYGQAGNTFTDVGPHEVSATVSLAGYTDWNGSATLSILPATFEGLYLAETTVEYDGQPHTIELTGDLPAGATFTYDDGHESFTQPGDYIVSGVVSATGYTDLEVSAALHIVMGTASEGLKVADFEGLTDNDLVDEFTFEYYNNGWVTPSTATLQIAENELIGNGEQTLRMNLSHQGNRFKVTKHFDGVMKKYGGIALDTLIDNYAEGAKTEILVQIWYDNLPLPDALSGYRRSYATWTLSTDCPSNWTHWEIPFTDASLSINSGAITSDQLSQLGLTVADMSQYISDVAVLVAPNYIGGGPKSYAYLDNIELIPAGSRQQEQYMPTGAKTYTIASTDGTAFKLSLGASNSARFETLNLETNIVLQGTYSRSADNITLRVATDLDDYQNTEIIFPLKGSKNFSQLEFTGSPSGNGAALLAPYAAHIDFTDKLFNKVITVDDFEYSSKGQGYDSGNADLSTPLSGLRGAYFGDMYAGSSGVASPIDSNWKLLNASGWPDYLEIDNEGNTGKAAKFRNHSSNQVRYMTAGLVNGTAKSLGRGHTTFSFFVKGTTETTMKMRVLYVNRVTASNQTLTSGDVKYMENIPVTTEWTQVEIPIDSTREVYGFMFHPTKANNRILLDDVELYGEANPHAVYVAPPLYQTINDGFYGVNAGGHFYEVELANNVEDATVSVDGTLLGDFTAEMALGKVTIKDIATTGANLTVVFNINNGALEVETASGSLAASYAALAGQTLVKVAKLNYDLQDKMSSVGNTLTDTNWVQEYNTGSAWTNAGSQMNLRKDNGPGTNVFCNMTCGDNSKEFRYTYQPQGGIGLANHFHVDLANNFSSIDIDYKIVLIYADDTEHYLAGDADNYVTIANGVGNRNSIDFNDWENIDEDFSDATIKAVRFVIKCAKAAGSYGYLYFDNLQVDYKVTPPAPSYFTLSDGDYYLWNSAEDAFLLEVSNSCTEGEVAKIGGGRYSFDVEKSGNNVTFTDNGFGGTAMVIEAELTDDNIFVINSVTGSYAAVFQASLEGKTAKPYANVSLNFEDGAGSGSYVDSHWTEDKYGSNWEAVQNVEMNSRSKNGSKVVNFVASNMTRRFIYQPDLPMGPVNHLDIDLGHYYDGSAANVIQYKIILIDVGGTEHYLAGSSSEFAEITKDTSSGLSTFSYDFGLTIGAKIKVVTKTSASNASYLYADNLVVSYLAA